MLEKKLDGREKGDEICHELFKYFAIQKYLSSSKFTMPEKQLLFKLRTKMFHAKANFFSMYINNVTCDYCESGDTQTQRHFLESCDAMINNSEIIADNIEVEHDYIYGNLKEQLKVTKMFVEIQEIREKMI